MNGEQSMDDREKTNREFWAAHKELAKIEALNQAARIGEQTVKERAELNGVTIGQQITHEQGLSGGR